MSQLGPTWVDRCSVVVSLSLATTTSILLAVASKRPVNAGHLRVRIQGNRGLCLARPQGSAKLHPVVTPVGPSTGPVAIILVICGRIRQGWAINRGDLPMWGRDGPSGPAIEAHELTKVYRGGVRAPERVTFRVAPGQVFRLPRA